MKSSSGNEIVPKAGRYRWGVFFVVSCLYLLVFFNRQAPAVLALDLIDALNLNGASLGLLSAAYFYPYALIQLPSGAIARAISPRLSLCLFFGLAGVGTIGFSCATDFHVALFWRVLVGVGTGMVLIPVLEIVSVWFRKDEFASMVGLLIGVGGVGVYAGAAPLSLLDRILGWRGSLQFVGAVSLFLVLCVWFVVRDRSIGESRSTTGGEGTGGASSATGGFFSQMKRVVATPAFWPPTIWAFFALGIFISFGGLWGGPYLMHVHGLDKVQAGHILGMLAVGMILGGPLLGVLAERVLRSRKLALVLTGGLLIMLTGWMLFEPGAGAIAGLCLWFGLLGLTTMAAAPLALTLIRNVFPDELAGTASGVANFFFLAGGAVMQQGIGWLLDFHGYVAMGDTAGLFNKVFIVYVLCATAAFLAACLSSGDR